MHSRSRIVAALFAIALVGGITGPPPAGAAELRVSYDAMGKLLARGAFQSEGRLFVQGSPDSKCRYAYLANPRVSAAGRRLQIRMDFATKIAVEVAGSCVGTGDEFEVVAVGVPVYRDGVLEMSEFRLLTLERAYGDVLEGVVRDVLAPRLRFPLVEHIERSAVILREETGVDLEVPVLDISEIRLGRAGLVMPFDFSVVLD